MLSLVATLLILTASPELAPATSEALAAGDYHYARRAEGARAGVALPKEIDNAIFDYHRAMMLDPSSLEPRLRLLRAYFFRGGFCGTGGRAQVTIFDDAKAVAEETVHLLDEQTGRSKARVGARSPAEAAAVYLWAAVSWGQWTVAHAATAAWQRAPARIRDLAQVAVTLDASAEQAGGHVILGRLHAEAPRVPFLTMWVDRRKGLEHLRTAYSLSPGSPQIQYFLADTLLKLDPSRADEAIALLQRCATQAPRPEYPVEDEHYAWQARDRLAAIAAARR